VLPSSSRPLFFACGTFSKQPYMARHNREEWGRIGKSLICKKRGYMSLLNFALRGRRILRSACFLLLICLPLAPSGIACADSPLDREQPSNKFIKAQNDRQAGVLLYKLSRLQQIFYRKNDRFIACSNEDCLEKLSAQYLKTSMEDVVLTFTIPGDGTYFIGTATHRYGSGNKAYWDSREPKLQQVDILKD